MLEWVYRAKQGLNSTDPSKKGTNGGKALKQGLNGRAGPLAHLGVRLLVARPRPQLTHALALLQHHRRL
eukprot:4945691-Pyramimonas_sp.AAC.1